MTTQNDYETTQSHAEPEWLLTEKALLGAVLVGGAYRDVEALLKAEHFYRPAHQMVWSAMGRVAQDGVVVEPLSVMNALMDAGKLRETGGAEYLLDLASGVLTSANVRTYALRVRHMDATRRLDEMLLTAKQRLVDGASPSDVQGELRAALDGAEMAPEGNALRISEVIDDFLEELDAGEDAETGTSLSWPYRDVNMDVLPMRPGQFILIAARPGVGKTVACVDIARHVGLTLGKPVVFHSLEMGRTEILNRIVSAESRIPLERMNRKALTDQDWKTIARWRATIEGAPLFIDERTEISVADVRASIRQTGARLAVVDYLGLMKFPSQGRNSDRQQDVAAGSRSLKITAKQEQVTVVAAHQLNRGSTQRSDKRPEMSDLRESGSLEQDADQIVLLHREDYYEPETVRAGEVDWIVAKQRAGKTGTIPLAALLHQARFGDLG